MPESSPTFVHDLGLALWIEVLRDLAHDAHQLALPSFEMGRLFLNEVEQVLLWLGREAQRRFAAITRGVLWQGAP